MTALAVGLPTSLTLAGTAEAASQPATNASFSGGSGTTVVGGQLYAKSGAQLTLSVSAPSDSMCVEVSGAHTAKQTSATAKSSWTFAVSAMSGEGAQAVTVAASPGFNKNGNCTGNSTSGQAAYTTDNTGPAVTPSLSPAPNSKGWNNANTTVTWTAADSGSGVASGPTPVSVVVSTNGASTLSSAATDRLGNTGSGSVTVRVDKTAPSITATQTTAGYGQPTTVTFTCTDPTSGGAEASGIEKCAADGTSPESNAITVSGNGTVSGTATDKAGNSKTLSVEVRNVDTTAPLLSGSPASAPNGAGWYRGNVSVHWTASDPESGIPAAPADTTITGEGTGLTSTTSVTNGAGLTTTAASSPAVKIDRTAPTTGITGTSNGWVNGNVSLILVPTDNYSGIDATSYSVDGALAQTGTSISLASEGDHTVTFSSIDKAGNAETPKTVHVKIDKTAPSISSSFTPSAYVNGAWTNGDVTVTFTCDDANGSGIASCTAPVTRTAEGESQQVVGTAADNAGNSASDTALVSIDKTAPSITATVDRPANSAGWYNDDVTVTYLATDGLSGVASVSPKRVLGEGDDQSAHGSATDAAGNSAGAGVTGINIDKTPPTLTATVPAGWHTGDVTVGWSCADGLSGIATGPADDVVTGEGANLTSTATCIDKAGNAVVKTVDGISIDRTAPTTSATVAAAPDSGWYTGEVTVSLDATDSLSKVAETRYTVDGGAAQTYSGAFPVPGDGVHDVRFWSVDTAGNTETAGAPLVLRVDATAPATQAVNPISPASGWFVTSGIPFAFSAADATSGTAKTLYTIDGGDPLTYGEPFTSDLSTGAHSVEFWSVDVAGNVEPRHTLTVKVDTIAPEITGAATPGPNAAGWNNTDVAVGFTCTDADSGIDGVAGCAGNTVLTNEAGDQKVQGDAVDVAGNRSSISFGPVNIDKTPPTLSGAPTSDGNAAGWYKDDVQIAWTGSDALSGIDSATQPVNSTITGEGSDLGAGPVTISDRAGNVSDPATVGGIKIDRTAPVVDGAATSATAPVGGWYRDEVVVRFTCTDQTSGVASCPTSRLVKGDGANQSVTSDPATDVAGNTSAGRTVDGINIDGTAPSTTSDNQCTKTNGWCTGSSAAVVLTSTDQAGLSGVKEIHFRVNGGAEQVAAGASKTVNVPLDGSGEATVSYHAVDNAGNVEPDNVVSLKYDNIAPAVTHLLTPKPNADEWNNSDVTVHFDAKDNDAGSGVDAASVTKDVVVSAETTGTLVTGSAKDTAGNVGTDAVTVKVDKTRPVVSAGVVSGTKGDNGWYVGPVTVHFTCSDALSGVATCPSDVTLTSNGSNTATGTATDKAGNSATATLTGITIDQERPSIPAANVAGATYVLGAVPAPTCTAADSVSGLASCAVTVTGGKANGVGTFTYAAKATDKAGNTASTTGTYRVVYRFDGFLQPINDTAHQIGSTTSVFKAGSTVPAKFALKRADGSLVQANVAPTWVTPVIGNATSAPVDETVYTAATDSGLTFRYDATAAQYIYNWKSASGGNYWRIAVTLDDGQTYPVNIALR